MKDKSSVSARSRKSAPDVAQLQADLERIERERARLTAQIVEKAAEAEQAGRVGTAKPRKRKSRKPHKRSWKQGRPAIPFDDFPLTPHGSGAWQKKINGTIHYFGKWAKVVDGKLTRIEGDGWKEALELYDAQIGDIRAGRAPRRPGERATVKHLCDRFYTAKDRQLTAGEITARTLEEYDATCERIVKTFGRDRLVEDLTAADFEKLRANLANQYGPVRLGNEIQRVRTVFKYGYEAGLLDKPVRFGPQFVKPSKHVLRKHRAAGGAKVFKADEVQRLLKAAGTQLKAMILLGINCGFGNADCGTLPLSAVDLKAGWIDYARPKTGVQRRCPLWPETVRALKTALANRPDPKSADHADLVFITKYGRPWSQGGASDAVTAETAKLLRDLDINGRRGLGFYALRHTFRTVADGTKDFTAIRCIMGHADDSIDANYTHGVDDARLQAVTDHVRGWLFPPKSKRRKSKTQVSTRRGRPRRRK